jgi:hypothetical protein
MKEKLVNDLTEEKNGIASQLKEKRNQEIELDKALSATRRDVSILEGRLIEINAVLEYLNNLPEESGEESLDN